MSSIEVAPNGCWIWQKSIKPNGYAQFGTSGSGSRYAHRASYETFVGPIPEGLQIDHRCHNEDPDCDLRNSCPHRRCVNPEHLQPATPAVNMHNSKHTQASKRAAVQACSNGHPYDLRNTYHRPKRGGRDCRICRAEVVANRQKKGQAIHRHIPPAERVHSGRVKKTHCPSNHPYVGENLYIDSRGQRQCRICRNAASQRSQARRAGKAT